MCEGEDEEYAEDAVDDAVVGGRIEFRVLDKDRKFSEPSQPTTIVARQTRVSRQELSHVVPAPPAFSSEEPPDDVPPPVLDLPPVTKAMSLQSSPGTHHEEGSIYYDAPPPEDATGTPKAVRHDDDFRSLKLRPYKCDKDEEGSKNEESFDTPSKEEKLTRKDGPQRRLGVVALPPVIEDHKDRDGELLTNYESAVNPPDTSKYESAMHDNTICPAGQESSRYDTVMGAPPQDSSRYESVLATRDHETRNRHDTICEEDRSLVSERRRSIENTIDEKLTEDERRNISVINLQDISSAFQTATVPLNRSRTVTPSVSPRSTPPHSESASGGRRSRSARHRRSCDNLLEEGSEQSSRTSSTPRPTDLKPRSSMSPDRQYQRNGSSLKSPVSEDGNMRSRIPVPTWSRGIKESDSEDALHSSGSKSPRFVDIDRVEAVKRITAALADKVQSPVDEDTASTRSLLSDQRSARAASLSRDGYQEDLSDELADLTPALRRRRQGIEKYVTDESQLSLRFQRRRTRPLSDVNPPPPILLQSRNRQRYSNFT